MLYTYRITWQLDTVLSVQHLLSQIKESAENVGLWMLEMKGGFTNKIDHLKIQPYLHPRVIRPYIGYGRVGFSLEGVQSSTI